MPLTIEEMRETDIEKIAKLRLLEFFAGTGRTLEEDVAGLRGLLGESGFETALVARVKGQPIGSVLLVRHELEPAHDLSPWLAGLVVAEDHRHHGIGTKLVSAVETRAKAFGLEKLYLYTWQARDFYAALGWQVVEAFTQGGSPMLLMSRPLHS